MEVLVIDAANVVGVRPDGWWKDRAGAARRLHEALMTADLPHDEVVLVLEGEAKGGHSAGTDGHVRTMHARGSGDDAIVQAVSALTAEDASAVVTAVTADRLLRRRIETAGARVMSPTWLLEQLDL
jgi:hypothetical protein